MSDVRIKLCQGRAGMRDVKLDRYWPGILINNDGDAWQRQIDIQRSPDEAPEARLRDHALRLPSE